MTTNQTDPRPAAPGRTALVLSGGGARGAYEAGVLAVLFEEILPRLPAGFSFDIVSGTSVGAVHAAYVAATSERVGPDRAKQLLETWEQMQLRDMLRVSTADLLGVPLRALGIRRMSRRAGDTGSQGGALGGLVDLSPLEHLVDARVPWDALPGNLAARRPSALCISCTEVRSGRVTVFMDGPDADPHPWKNDPGAKAIPAEIRADHVRASAAIPFLFPAVRLRERYYVDGGLRMNTPLSPALRLRADRVLVIALKHAPLRSAGLPAYTEDVITQPAFLMGKVLNALLLDQLESELRQLELVNAWIAEGREAFGDGFLPRINGAVRRRRGVGYRPVQVTAIRPSEDVGQLAAQCYREGGKERIGGIPALLLGAALRGVPKDEADLLSYLYFDACYTGRLVALGRRDARAHADEIVALLRGDEAAPGDEPPGNRVSEDAPA